MVRKAIAKFLAEEWYDLTLAATLGMDSTGQAWKLGDQLKGSCNNPGESDSDQRTDYRREEKLLHSADILRIKPGGFRYRMWNKQTKKNQNDSKVWDLRNLDNVEMRKTMREVVWSWGSEFSFGHVWDAYLNQREMLNRRLDMWVWS